MTHLTTTPFGPRPVSACLLQHVKDAQQPPALPRVDKWEVFRELTVAKAAYGLSDRELTVLNALLSFHSGAHLSDNAPLIVFPSNRSLCERAHGMAESTLRRHLASLVRSGMILRHDSPNGKRYASRDDDGMIEVAFGFDLRPLLVQARDITEQAAVIRAEWAAYKKQRTAVVLLIRDLQKLVEYGQENHPSQKCLAIEPQVAEARRAVRRKLSRSELDKLALSVDSLLKMVNNYISSQLMRGNDSHIERHYSNSNTEYIDSEPCCETANGQSASSHSRDMNNGKGKNIIHWNEPKVDSQTRSANEGIPPEPPCPIPLELVVRACPDLAVFGQRNIKSWYDLVASASHVRASMGISPSAWQQAQAHMGERNAAVTVAAMLQRMKDIHNPGGYLRSLTRKAADKKFSPGPMVMALLSG